MKKATKSDLIANTAFQPLTEECMYNVSGGCSRATTTSATLFQLFASNIPCNVTGHRN